MIQDFFTEIIAGVAILILIIIYFVIVRSKQNQKNELEDIKNAMSREPSKLVEINFESLVNEKDEEAKEEKEDLDSDKIFELRGEEEGSFGNIEQNPFIEEAETKHRVRCEVPSHGKISKENFKEFAGVKLLIAEDNLINQKVIAGLLADSGIEITIADDGKIALDILKQNSDFNMVLMDVHMPRMNGFEATEIIRANPNYEHIVVIALSGDIAADDIRKMTEAGMQEHLEKPLRMDAFYDILYAYTKNDSDAENSEFIEVVMTNELKGEKGLEICGGDDKFYKAILKEFRDSYSDSSKKIYEYMKNDDVASADAMLLDMIGLAANIGADNIQEIAQDLKEAIKDTEEKSYVTLMDQYDKHLAALMRDIRDYL